MTGASRSWAFANPTKLIFGDNALDELANQLKALPSIERCSLVVGGSAATSHGYAEMVAQKLHPIKVISHSGVAPEPEQSQAERLRAELRREGAELVIALGGGSVMDTAKVACAAVADSDLTIADLMDRRAAPPARDRMLVAIPTTAGSGSEVTPFAVLTNPATGLKQSLPSPALYPDYAVVCPALLRTVPRKVASDTGMDALAHAFEALWSTRANPVSDSLAYSAIELIAKHFVGYLDTPDAAEHASSMAMAASLAGVAFSNTFTAACHALSYPIGATFGLSHGAACAVTLDLVAHLNSEAVSAKFDKIAKLLGVESAAKVPDVIAEIRASTRCISTFAELEPSESQLEAIADGAFQPLLANNPVPLDRAAILRLLGGKVRT